MWSRGGRPLRLIVKFFCLSNVVCLHWRLLYCFKLHILPVMCMKMRRNAVEIYIWMSCFFNFLVPFGNTRNRTELSETELGTDRFQFLGTRITRIPEEPNRSVSGTRMPRVTYGRQNMERPKGSNNISDLKRVPHQRSHRSRSAVLISRLKNTVC
jgi:hypothetical protein